MIPPPLENNNVKPENPLTWETKEGSAWVNDHGFCFTYDFDVAMFGVRFSLMMDQLVDGVGLAPSLHVELLGICDGCGRALLVEPHETCRQCGHPTPPDSVMDFQMDDHILRKEESAQLQGFLEGKFQRALAEDPLVCYMKAEVARRAIERFILNVIELANEEDAELFLAKWPGLSRHFMLENGNARALLRALSGAA